MTESQQRLKNLYIARPTTQERPCFVCSKFTSVVLTSADNSNADWFYICRTHLGDFNFCSKLGGKSVKSPTAADVKKAEALANRPHESDSVSDLVSSIGSAWKSWRSTKKPEDEKEKEKEKEKEDKEEKKENKEEKNQEITVTANTPPPVTSTPSSPQQPVRFVIQRDYFYLRQREYIKKIQKKEAAAKLKTLNFPEVPKNIPTMQQ
jgi:multidrug efflux pump subunit AcrB